MFSGLATSQDNAGRGRRERWLIERVMTWYAESGATGHTSNDFVTAIHAIDQGIHGLYAGDRRCNYDLEAPERGVVDGSVQGRVELGAGG